MRKIKTYYLFALTFMLSFTCFGQDLAVTNIKKNINDEAKGLEQRLNATLDTLILKSDKEILRVTFLSHEEKDSEIIDVGSHEVKIPLYHLKQGRYTIAVYREDKIIALGVKRVDPIPVPDNAIADLEESILRSSLTEEQQLDRNIKPLKKKINISSDNNKNTRLASAKPKQKVNNRTSSNRANKDRTSRASQSQSTKQNTKSKDIRVASANSKSHNHSNVNSRYSRYNTKNKQNTRIASAKSKSTDDNKNTSIASANSKIKETSRDKQEKSIKTNSKTSTKNNKDVRVASANSEKETKPKRKVKKRPNAGKKSGFALALERKEKAAKESLASLEKEIDLKETVANKPASKDKKSQGTLITVTKVTYNLTDKNSETLKKQTRADYRANNLRPNGKPYEN